MSTVSVSVSDFPTYDGSGPPKDFLRQCSRLAELGGLPDSKLGAIIAARCRGLALTVVNTIEETGGELSLTAVTAQLRAHFGGASGSVEQASQGLATLAKGHLSAQSYALNVRQLVREACPEMFGEDGQVKKICVPSYNAALYRHFLVGLSSEERCLLSRQKASTFEQCLDELIREESLEVAEVTSAASGRHVRWGGPDGPSRDVAPRQQSPAAHSRSRGGSPGAGSRGPSARDQRWRVDTEDGDEDSGAQECRSGTPDRRSRWDSPVAYRSSPDARDWQNRSRDRAGESTRSRRRSSSPGDGRSWRPSDADRTRTWTRSFADVCYRAEERGMSPSRGGFRQGGTRQPRPGSRALPQRAATRETARDSSPDWDDCVEGRRAGIVRCWSCGGVGHFKRQCPNEVAGRRNRF